MRYWIYKDSRILGPLAKEDFVAAGGLKPESLVAEESAGVREDDWRCAADISDLSDFLEGLVGERSQKGVGPGPSSATLAEDWLAEVFSQELPLLEIDLGTVEESVPREEAPPQPASTVAPEPITPEDVAPQPPAAAPEPAVEQAPSPEPEAQRTVRGRLRVVKLSAAKSFETVMPKEDPVVTPPAPAPMAELAAPPVLVPAEPAQLTTMTSPFQANSMLQTFPEMMASSKTEVPLALPPPPAPSAQAVPVAQQPPLEVQPSSQETREVLAKLAKPKPAKTATVKKPRARRQRAFLVISGLLAAALAAAGWFFFVRDSKDISTAVNMDSGRPPVGSEVPEAPLSSPAAPAPQEPLSPQAASVAPAVPHPAPAPQAPAIRDERSAAIDLVKNYPLAGERGSVGAWLQYSFAASPGETSSEKWDAGAVEESTYLVQYTVQPSGGRAPGTITYLFEADLARQTVRGKNPAARQLMSGGGVLAPASVRKRPARRSVAPAKPDSSSQLPLPADSELEAPVAQEKQP